MITMGERLVIMSTLNNVRAEEHFIDVYNNGGYINYNYGEEFYVTLLPSMEVIIEDEEFIVTLESDNYEVTVEDD